MVLTESKTYLTPQIDVGTTAESVPSALRCLSVVIDSADAKRTHEAVVPL